jgi:hypothetical protein
MDTEPKSNFDGIDKKQRGHDAWPVDTNSATAKIQQLALDDYDTYGLSERVSLEDSLERLEWPAALNDAVDLLTYHDASDIYEDALNDLADAQEDIDYLR